ncbi:7287_t:CDS:1, partial [Cetraspora pellucida]
DTWRIFSDFNLVKILLSKIKETFVNSSARKGRYLNHLRMHGVENL